MRKKRTLNARACCFVCVRVTVRRGGAGNPLFLLPPLKMNKVGLRSRKKKKSSCSFGGRRTKNRIHRPCFFLLKNREQQARCGPVFRAAMASPSSAAPGDGADDVDLTLRPHAAAPGGGGAGGLSKPFFGEKLELDLAMVTTTPTTSLDAAAIPPSPLLRAALTRQAPPPPPSSSLGGGGLGAEDSSPLLNSYLTPQTAALAAELSALAVLGTSDAPLEVAAARDGAPPEGAPLHLVVKKVSAATMGRWNSRKRGDLFAPEARERGSKEAEREGMFPSVFFRRWMMLAKERHLGPRKKNLSLSQPRPPLSFF